MNKLLKGFAIGLLMIAAAVAPACRSRRQPVTTPTTTQATVPDVPTTVTTETRVDTQPPDFVQETPRPVAEELPTDIEQLNRVVQERGFIRDAFFAYNESTLSADAQAALGTSADWLKQNAQYNLLIEGHCDERGTEQYNLALGDRRANTVRQFLITLGLEGSRLRTVSYGEERPFDESHTEEAWARNRRAHLVLVGTAR